jgi:hypothetical protein
MPVHADFWPAGSVLLCALGAIAAMHAFERYAAIAAKIRTRQALERALGEPQQDVEHPASPEQ